MIIIAGYTLTEADARDAAVKAHADMVSRARQHDGCIDLAISADSVNPDRVNIYELWRDQQSLDGWRKVANPPKIERRETHVKLYRTDKSEEPF